MVPSLKSELGSGIWEPSCRPAAVNSDCASDTVKSDRSGTAIVFGSTPTVRTTVEPRSTCVPPGGFWSRTMPMSSAFSVGSVSRTTLMSLDSRSCFAAR